MAWTLPNTLLGRFYELCVFLRKIESYQAVRVLRVFQESATCAVGSFETVGVCCHRNLAIAPFAMRNQNHNLAELVSQLNCNSLVLIYVWFPTGGRKAITN